MKSHRGKKKVFLDHSTFKTGKALILPVAIIYGLLSLALYRTMGTSSLMISLPLLLAIILYSQMETALRLHRSIKKHHLYITRQNQALDSIHSFLGCDRPLPIFGQAAIDPDFAQVIMSQIIARRPSTILELGSGTSTVIAGLTLKKNGNGRLWSLEHDAGYAEKTRRQVDDYGLAGTVDVVFCPLVEVRIDSQTFQWYDLSRVKDLASVDLLIVDGPPSNLQPRSRYPALPLLYENLSQKAVILIDDARRGDEQASVDLWARQYKDLTFDFLNTQKGAFKITREAVKPGTARWEGSE